MALTDDELEVVLMLAMFGMIAVADKLPGVKDMYAQYHEGVGPIVDRIRMARIEAYTGENISNAIDYVLESEGRTRDWMLAMARRADEPESVS